MSGSKYCIRSVFRPHNQYPNKFISQMCTLKHQATND
uniref:Uncharacterized protein n=1 Tax=Rhizophora mucronata TaxID=61149 RepID=A0A2P2NNT7_RHIMU